MPLFTYPPAPFALQADGAASSNAGGAVTAGSAYYMAYTLTAPVTITQMRCTVSTGSPSGNIDMGIYDATAANGLPNNLLGHTGAIAATTGIFTKSLTANLTLSPGQYWLAFLDTAADSVWLRVNTASNTPTIKTTATNLASLGSTAGAGANNANVIQVIALLSGGWS